jgi:hypothetical protein
MGMWPSTAMLSLMMLRKASRRMQAPAPAALASAEPPISRAAAEPRTRTSTWASSTTPSPGQGPIIDTFTKAAQSGTLAEQKHGCAGEECVGTQGLRWPADRPVDLTKSGMPIPPLCSTAVTFIAVWGSLAAPDGGMTVDPRQSTTFHAYNRGRDKSHAGI